MFWKRRGKGLSVLTLGGGVGGGGRGGVVWEEGEGGGGVREELVSRGESQREQGERKRLLRGKT